MSDETSTEQTSTDQDGTEETTETTAEGQESTEGTTDSDTTDWKAMARKHEREAKANREAARELAALKAKDQTETERLAAERDAERERSKKATQRAVRAEVKSVASTLKFKDPSDALRLLDLDDLTDDDGEVDEDAVKAALKSIADTKPYLLDGPTVPAKSGGQVAGGASGGEKDVEDYVAEFNKH